MMLSRTLTPSLGALIFLAACGIGVGDSIVIVP